MRGIVKGEATSATNPILQAFIRSGETLVDVYDATYEIQDIKDPTVDPVVKVVATTLTSTHKLSTGRYWVPVGDTSTYSYGTHRAIIRYRLTVTGQTHIQIIEFEVLASGNWVTGAQYNGYISTRNMIADSYVASTTTPQSLHRRIDMLSKYIEKRCGHFFEPRYLTLRLKGSNSPVLFLPESVIALESVENIWKTDSATEDSYLYDADTYRVYNRHLDTHHDDRNAPHIKRLDGQAWPHGFQNFRIKGVFGFTEPNAQLLSERTGIGSTPVELSSVVAALVVRNITDPSLSDPATQNPGSIQSYKTRDQSIAFNNAGAFTAGPNDSITGDSILDQRLMPFMRPAGVHLIGAEPYEVDDTISYSDEFSG